MARHSHLRKLADDWPVIFAAGVAIWFAVVSLGLNGFSFGDGDATASGDDTLKTSTTNSSSGSIDTETKPEPVTAGPLKFKIVAFSVKPNKKNPMVADAKLTLELHNTTKENVSFYPSQIALSDIDAGTPPAGPKEDIIMGVSPNLAVTAPITFQVTPNPATTYQLTYAGKTIYTGMAF